MEPTDEQLHNDLKEDEGVIPYAYQDSLGYWTIGVGRLVDKRKGGKLSTDEIELMLSNDLKQVFSDLDAKLPWWRTLTLERQRVLANMCFNLGIDKLLGFKNTLDYIQKGQYALAASGMLNSLWAKQVGARADRLAERMRNG